MNIAFRNEIDVTVTPVEGVIAAVEILPRARPPLSRLFAGKPAASLPAVLPRLFSLCSTAHQAAFLSAVEAARGEEASAEAKRRRTAAVMTERLTELARGLFLGRLALDAASAAALRELMQAAATLGAARGEGAGEPRARLMAALAALGILRDAALLPGSALAQHVAELEKSALLPMLSEQPFLRAADDRAVVVRLLAEGEAFSGAPDLAGCVPETGVWARHATRACASPAPAGPVERLRAKVAEVARLATWLPGGGDSELDESTAEAYPLGTRRGAAAVECARGRVHHAVELDSDDRIVRFEYLAPTEWNFHANGPLVRALRGATLAEGPRGQDAVRIMVGSFDPCVGFNLNFREAAHA